MAEWYGAGLATARSRGSNERNLLFIDAIHIDDDKRLNFLTFLTRVCVMFNRLSFLAGVFKLPPVGTRDGGQGPLFPTF